MKKLIVLSILIVFKSLVAGEGEDEIQLEHNLEKFNLIEFSFQSADSLHSEEIEEKSVMRAALYSAVIPGTGQYYAGSIWKAALFAGIEIAGWTVYFVNTSKGDNQETQMEAYADDHWSEQKYWSYLYHKGKDAGLIDPDTYLVDENNILINYDADVVNHLRYLEEGLGHTHRLPETKTQQYYEMIVKYLTQFGNAWEDANFIDYYYGNTDKMTAQMFTYRDMRNDMNEYYDVASIATNVILINHALSALDAAWTAGRYNREITMKIRAYNKRYFDENVQMVGINLSW
ncbi:MAG: hypothetical protein KAS58_02055 [Calditrichia bacterium]|nr:hypothetical protein [Calditrichia bacterium]